MKEKKEMSKTEMSKTERIPRICVGVDLHKLQFTVCAINEETVICVNHFSHNGNPLHAHLSERADEYGYLVSYDGFEVNI